MWFFAPLKHAGKKKSKLGGCGWAGCMEQAWFTIEQRKNLREPFAWAIENRLIPGGALLVIYRGDVVLREEFGLADIEATRPFAVDTLCRIASVTKPHMAG